MSMVQARFLGALLIAGSALTPANAEPAAWTPLQLSLWNPVQLAPGDWDVWGIRLNAGYGLNRTLYGLDCGLVNVLHGTFMGVQAGAANLAPAGGSALSGLGRGVQLAFFVNVAGSLDGLQLGFSNNAEDLAGLQLGGLNLADRMAGVQCGLVFNTILNEAAGVQLGFWNNFGIPSELVNRMRAHNPVLADRASARRCEGFAGLQAGLFNTAYAAPVSGAQVGLFNRADDLRGLQIAAVNVADAMKGVQVGLVNIIGNSPLPFFPIVNARF